MANAASRPSSFGSSSTPPATVPSAVLATQSTYRKSPAPTRTGHSKRPLRPEIAQDSSTMSCDSASRRSRPPRKIPATVTLSAT